MKSDDEEEKTKHHSVKEIISRYKGIVDGNGLQLKEVDRRLFNLVSDTNEFISWRKKVRSLDTFHSKQKFK